MLYICIPTYDEAPTVGVLLWRIRKVFQDYAREYEILVYDDASTDTTREILEPYTKALIEACATKQNTPIRKGDVVLFHSGWMDLIATDLATYNKGEPGLGKDGAAYLASKDVMAVGADTWALEVLPSEDKNEAFPIHQILLPMNGIYILENMVTRDLAKDAGYEFMFVLGAARMTGAVQMIINPVAIR